ncbi:tetratricopeptide repeat protein [Alkalimonas sp. NCh-2]|uniref:tetratricopeptide repeat protein n=1 Tax=Alkalimonas sp. NCh-2 TaxID=3144846 RepID=UPI0031F6F671
MLKVSRILMTAFCFILFSGDGKARPNQCDSILPIDILRAKNMEQQEAKLNEYWSELFANAPTPQEWNMPAGWLKAQMAFSFGECYMDGLAGATPNVDKAIPYFEYGTELGNTTSAHVLASLRLFYVRDVELQKLGFDYLNDEYLTGSMFAAGKLGEAYQLGLGTDKDLITAINFYQLAAEHGNTNWQYLLAHAYRKGYLGLPKSDANYLFWLNYQPKNHTVNYSCRVSELYRREIFPSSFLKRAIWTYRCRTS